MWEKFTSSSKRVIKTAHEEAKEFRNDAVYPEHILLGILRDESSFAVKMLVEMGVDIEKLRPAVIQKIPIGSYDYENHNFSRLSKKVLELAYREARDFRHTFIGSAHLLLAVLKLGESDAFNLLVEHGVTYESAREKLEEMTQKHPYPEDETVEEKKEPVTPEVELKEFPRSAFDLQQTMRPDFGVWGKFPDSVKRMMKVAHEVAKAKGSREVDVEHLLIGMLSIRDSLAVEALTRLQVDVKKLQQEVEILIPRDQPGGKGILFSDAAKKAMERAWDVARRMHHKHIGVEHFLLAILGMPENRIRRLLEAHGVTEDGLKATIFGIHQMRVSDEETEEKYTADQPSEGLTISLESDVLLKKAIGEARLRGDNTIRPEHILLALLKLPELDASKFLMGQGITMEQLEKWLKKGEEKEES